MISDLVRDSYDANAALYASLFLDALDTDTRTRHRLDTFAADALQRGGPVADLGCGPGNVVDHLCRLGVTAVGYDLSPGQIEQARIAFPDREFHVGDLTALRCEDRSLGGVVSRYSIIHLDPTSLGPVFSEWVRVLAPAAPMFVSFFGSRSADAHGTAFDHKVATAHELWPPAIAEELAHAGFVGIEVDTAPIPEGGRPFDDAIIVGRTPDTADLATT